MTWSNHPVKGGDIHVVPLEDAQVHYLDASCWCQPARDRDEPSVVIHNAADGREFAEEGNAEWSTTTERKMQ